jgi:hypothetical protein
MAYQRDESKPCRTPDESAPNLNPDYDTQMEISNTIKELDIELNTQWVNGYQDDTTDIKHLSYQKYYHLDINTDCDSRVP